MMMCARFWAMLQIVESIWHNCRICFWIFSIETFFLRLPNLCLFHEPSPILKILKMMGPHRRRLVLPVLSSLRRKFLLESMVLFRMLSVMMLMVMAMTVSMTMFTSMSVLVLMGRMSLCLNNLLLLLLLFFIIYLFSFFFPFLLKLLLFCVFLFNLSHFVLFLVELCLLSSILFH